MSQETPEQRAERQARLSKAMGAMFLQDKVEKLEKDGPRGFRKTQSSSASIASSSRHDPTRIIVRSMPRASTGPGFVAVSDVRTQDPSHPPRSSTTLRLVDASVLIFSLRSVHNWDRDGSACIIVPSEAINTLDLLKKGDDQINLAARKATRWLEERIKPSPSSLSSDTPTDLQPGIFAQIEAQRAALSELEARRSHTAMVGTAQSSDLTEFDSLPDADTFAPKQAPRYIRELLSACLFVQTKITSQIDYSIAIAYAPPNVQVQMLDGLDSGKPHATPSYLSRVDGRATEAWLNAYALPVEVVPTSKTWTGEKSTTKLHASSASTFDRQGSPKLGSNMSEFGSMTVLKPHHRSPHRRSDAYLPGGTPSSSRDSLLNLTSSDMSDDGPIIVRPSSASSSTTSLASYFTASTNDDRSSQQSNGPSSKARWHPPAGSNNPGSATPVSAATPLTSKPLFKTRSGAEKMEEYLKRLES